MTLLFDGSFEGLLTALYWSYHYKTKMIFSQYAYQANLLDQSQLIHTDTYLASKMANRIQHRFGERSFSKILYAYLSESDQTAIIIREFLDYAVSVNHAIDNFGNEKVYPLLKLARAVERESHLLVGLLRFEQLDSSIYYASFEPTYDLLSILAPHFEKRLSDQSWVIHDTKRKKAVFYNQEHTWSAPLEDLKTLSLHQKEEEFQKLWKHYYEHIGIKERYNPKLRMNFMPKKYWKHLTEFKTGS